MMKSKEKEIAFRDNILEREEKLPYPVVSYPSHYGTFFIFQEDSTNILFLCECSKNAIFNFLLLQQFQLLNKEIVFNIKLNFERHFPKYFASQSRNGRIQKARFEYQICHECNRTEPNLLYCHKMYGSSFKQEYGWYINKQYFEWGINPLLFKFIENTEGFAYLNQKIPGFYEVIKKFYYFADNHRLNSIEARPAIEEYNQTTRLIHNIIEDKVRKKFGKKLIGETWTKETELFYLVKSVVTNVEIKRHFRPYFLNGLELDMYIPGMKIGIEYQGIQHFKPIEHWGGLEAFKLIQQRDKRKKEICQVQNIRLIYFNYFDKINERLVRERIFTRLLM